MVLTETILYLLILLQSIYLFYLIFPFINVIIGILSKEKRNPTKEYPETDFACLITAYKETEIFIPLIDSLLKQRYSNYHIYVVADGCPKGPIAITDNKLSYILPENNLSSKVKSILFGYNHFVRNHDAVVIFDPDNLAHPDFLLEINRYFQQGFKAVQGKRTAKNLDSIYACLDAVGEYYYNHTQRLVPFLLGSSAPIAGSGMAIDCQIYKTSLVQLESSTEGIIIAEDKQLQIDLLKKNLRIAYAKNAIVFDEKVTSGYQVERQRTRWLSSYFKHLNEAISLIFTGIRNFNFNQFYFGIVTSIPPMIVTILATIIFLIFDILISKALFVITLISLFVFVFTFLLVLALNKVEKEIWKSLWGVFFFAFNQISALLKLKKSKIDFMVTSHTKYLTIDEVLQRKLK